MPRFLHARTLVAVFACGVLAAAAAEAGSPTAARAAVQRCGASAPTVLSYGWPVRPFDRPHPVRGNFGDPRTIYWGLLNDLDHGGSFQFHNGIDISAPAGTAVYPVVSGVVARVSFDWLAVQTPGRRFQYWHIRPSVTAGEHVTARSTVLGRIVLGADHVHLTELDGTTPVNPLQPGHLTPYWDATPPSIRAIDLRGANGPFLHGRVWFVADAYDYPSLTPPLPWGERPVTPAVVSWMLRDPRGAPVVPLRVAADFRRRLPPRRDFWHVYASRTRQNQPTIAYVHWHTPGRYLFDLTPGGFDTRRLRDGRYRLTVIASDICGNTATRSETLAIRNKGGHGSLTSILASVR